MCLCDQIPKQKLQRPLHVFAVPEAPIYIGDSTTYEVADNYGDSGFASVTEPDTFIRMDLGKLYRVTSVITDIEFSNAEAVQHLNIFISQRDTISEMNRQNLQTDWLTVHNGSQVDASQVNNIRLERSMLARHIGIHVIVQDAPQTGAALQLNVFDVMAYRKCNNESKTINCTQIHSVPHDMSVCGNDFITCDGTYSLARLYTVMHPDLSNATTNQFAKQIDCDSTEFCEYVNSDTIYLYKTRPVI